MDLSPENKEKMDKCNALMDSLTKRMDSLQQRRAKADAEEAQWKADRAKAKADSHLASERTADFLDPPIYNPPAWFPDNFMDEEREELRQGALSKDQI